MAENFQTSGESNMSPKDPGSDNYGGKASDVIETPEESEEVLAEIERVNDNLDSLNSALDFIEQRTDNIRNQLLMLLESSREVRQEIKTETPMDEDSSNKDDSKSNQ